ncbi:MAG: squalene/phytoene synthase family protein [Alphaproteobacteria bacterium]|nr:squalene/phytoene synthase family protein [Alphaproteobacteria bacterium]
MAKKEYNINIFPLHPFLIKRRYRKVTCSYFKFITYAKNIADNANIQSYSRMQDLCEMEDLFFYQRECKSERFAYMLDLRKEFEKELLAPALVVDIISALKKDASDFRYEVKSQLVEYYKNYAGTMGRFLLASHNENPSTYMPADALCIAFQMLNNLIHMKMDGITKKRFYISQDLMEQYQVAPKDLYFTVMSKNTKNLIKEILKEIKGLLQDAKILPSIIKNNRLRIQFCTLLSLSHILYDKIAGKDFLKKDIKISKFNHLNALITGIFEGTFTSYKELSVKRLKKK